MTSLLRRLFRREQNPQEPVVEESFAARFHRFKLFLNAHLEAYSAMMTLEERLGDATPLGIPFLRMSTAKLTVATMQCIMHLNALGKGSYTRLDAPFAALRNTITETMSKGIKPIEGPLVVSFEDVGLEHSDVISSNFTKLEAIRKQHPEFMPRGFIVTGAAWWNYFNNTDMHEEIDRIMLISQDDPASYNAAGATIRERLHASFPLPPDLVAAVEQELARILPELEKTGSSLLVRSLPVRPEHAALVIPEQLIVPPIDTAAVVHAVLAGLAKTFQARALIYRLKRGIRDRAMPFCLSVTIIPAEHGRGSVHRKLNRLGEEELFLHVRRGFTIPEEEAAQNFVEGASLPEAAQQQIEASCRVALDCLADAPVPGNRHEIYWTMGSEGTFFIHGVNAIPDPTEVCAFSSAADGGNRVVVTPNKCGQGVYLEGGFTTYPGVVRGKVALVRNLEDALNFPIGSILVISHAAPRWSFLVDFAVGVIAGDGTGNGLFARTARRYGRPTVLGLSDAFEQLEDGQEIWIIADTDKAPVICAVATNQEAETPLTPVGEAIAATAEAENRNEHDQSASKSSASSKESAPKTTAHSESHAKEGASAPTEAFTPVVEDAVARSLEYTSSTTPRWLLDSAMGDIARELAPKVAAVTLPDSEDADFRAENCTTYHDFLTYCHDYAVQEMFRASTSRKTSQAPSKQLVCDVPKQFWIINLDDGFYGEVKGPVVNLEQIASLPMRSLWEGFSDKTWEGPPQLDAKGFLSVLFEATANPNLVPGAQSTQYAEKNVFLIAKRFCSMRCRFGFHFLSLDCLLGERPNERFVVFQFKGGAANITRRIRRVHFVAELLAQFDFATEISGDTLTARLEDGSEEEFLSALRVVGYLVMHTRQLDMIMGNEQELAVRRLQMLDDMLSLAARPPLVLPDA